MIFYYYFSFMSGKRKEKCKFCWEVYFVNVRMRVASSFGNHLKLANGIALFSAIVKKTLISL